MTDPERTGGELSTGTEEHPRRGWHRRPGRRRMAGGGAVAFAAGALVLAACGTGPSAASTSTGKKAAASSSGKTSGKTLTTITVGGVQTANLGNLFTGIVSGVFQKYGLNVKYQVLTPSATVAAVDAGSIDVGDDGAGMVTGVIKSKASKIFMENGPGLFYLAVPKSVKSLKTLAGKTVSASTPGGAIDTALRDSLKAAGVTVGTAAGDAHITYLSTNSAALASLKDGTVDGAGVSPPTSIQAEEQGDHLLSLVKYSFDSVWAVNNSFAKSNKKALDDFVKAFAVATKKTTSTLTACEQGLTQFVGITNTAQLKGSCQQYGPYFAVAPMPACQISAIEKGLTPPESVTPGTLVTNSYLKQLGKQNWVTGKPAYSC